MFSDIQVKQKLDHFLQKAKLPETLVILGSGWNKILETAKAELEIPYSELFGVQTSVPGHQGKLVVAKVGPKAKRVAFMSGRFHLYEGYSAVEATTPIRVLAKAGVEKVVLTAACGALNEKYRVGDFVVMSDLLTLFLALNNPLVGPNFVDLSEIFSPAWRKLAVAACVKHDIQVHEGVYCYYHGPNFESPADKMAFRFLGGDVVGMSTVPEAISARSQQLEILGLGFVTNLAFVKHDHKDVLAAADKGSQEMVKLLSDIL